MHTIFYSWQSDASRKVNHDFIGECLRSAADQISLNSGQSLEVLDGVRGESGTPALADTILERISAAHVYVADISLVYEAVGNANRRSPNPNVVFELGYAMAELSRGRVISVSNDHFGSPDYLPFDLQHLRWPLRYTLAPGSSNEQKAKCKTSLTSALQKAITAVLSVDGPQRSLVPKRAAVTSALALLVERNNAWQLAIKRHAPVELKKLGIEKTERIKKITTELGTALSAASTIWALDSIEKVIADLLLSIAGQEHSIEQISLEAEEIEQLNDLINKISATQQNIERLDAEKRIVDAELASLASKLSAGESNTL